MFYLSHSLFSTISNEKSLSLHHGFPVYNIFLLDCYQDFLFYLRFGFQQCDYNETSYLEFAELLGLVKLSLYPKFERFSGIIVLLFLNVYSVSLLMKFQLYICKTFNYYSSCPWVHENLFRFPQFFSYLFLDWIVSIYLS